MKNIRTYSFLSCIALTIILFAGACKKSSNDSTQPTHQYLATWTVGSTTYNSNSYSSSGGIISIHANDTAVLLFLFSATPTVSGTYNIVNGKNGNLAANEIGIEINASTYDRYYSTGTDSKTATVTVNGDSIGVSFPSISVTHYLDTAAVGTTTAQGVLYEY